MDTSAGGYHLILNYRKISNLKKALVISPVLSLNTDLLYKSIKKLNNEQLVICVGAEGREYELSKSLLEGSSVKPIYFDKADHYFTNMLDEYIDLSFKYLLKKK
jgi:hypothetical protein